MIALSLICGGAFLVLVALVDYAYKAWVRWSESQAKLKRDLSVALRNVEQLKLENAMLTVSLNMRSTALSVRKRPRGMHIVGNV